MRSGRVLVLGSVVAAFGIAVSALPSSVDARRNRRRTGVTKIPPRTAEGLPNVQSSSALVVDFGAGVEVYSKNPDEIRHIASVSKVFVALTVRRHDIDLDAYTEITEEDRQYARGGARTRLPVGRKFTNRNLLHAMLVASDNRAPTALGRAVGMSPDQLVAAMNAVARDLGLVSSSFTDPSGLRGNVSTARELAVAFKIAMEDPVLREIMSTHEVDVASENAQTRVRYFNTNLILRQGRHDVQCGKTGYTAAAGYCLVTAAQFGGNDVVFVLLGSSGKLTRFGDFNRVADWLEDETATKPAHVQPTDTRGVGAAALAPQGLTPMLLERARDAVADTAGEGVGAPAAAAPAAAGPAATGPASAGPAAAAPATSAVAQ